MPWHLLPKSQKRIWFKNEQKHLQLAENQSDTDLPDGESAAADTGTEKPADPKAPKATTAAAKTGATN